jgi:D-serine deaminase-like pyridoxal phosphate-dependent protein
MTRFRELDPSTYALPEGFSAGLLSPALIVYLDRVRENLRRMTAYLDGRVDRWRPHVKTTKIPRVFTEVARAGVRHFKCATTRETALLLDTLEQEGIGNADVLCAYPLIGPALERLARIARSHPRARVSVLAEDPSAVAALPAELSVFVDVDPGMHRTGVPLEDTARILDVARRADGRFRGVHYYDGHLHGGLAADRRGRVRTCYGRLISLADELARGGIAVGELITSGTPTFLDALAHPELAQRPHRVSPGTVVYHDLRSEQECENLDLVPAALVFTRVVSHPAHDVVTCDAGSKSIAAEAGDPCAFAIGEGGLEALAPSEEHLPLRVAHGPRPERGRELLLVPRHVCPTVNLADEAVLIDGAVSEIVPVSARGHELRLESPEPTYGSAQEP